MPVTGSDDAGNGLPEAEWTWRKVRKAMAAEQRTAAASRKRGFLQLPRADRHRKVTLIVSWKGGTESYWLVEARGRSQVFAGHLCLEDVMARVLSER